MFAKTVPKYEVEISTYQSIWSRGCHVLEGEQAHDWTPTSYVLALRIFFFYSHLPSPQPHCWRLEEGDDHHHYKLYSNIHFPQNSSGRAGFWASLKKLMMLWWWAQRTPPCKGYLQCPTQSGRMMMHLPETLGPQETVSSRVVVSCGVAPLKEYCWQLLLGDSMMQVRDSSMTLSW